MAKRQLSAAFFIAMTESIKAGECVLLSPLVRRITAPNPSIMTGPGTNSYLIGKEQIAVIDPGPAEPSHIEAILKACDGKLKWILVTHTHRDHSPAAQHLAAQTGAQLIGNVLPENDGFQDQSFKPAVNLAHDEVFNTPEFSLTAIHTPGHVDNHLCFLLHEEGMLFTGDHIMQGSTVVIIPPHGDMQAYIKSLTILLGYDLAVMAPGHGTVIGEPVQEVKRIIEHRLNREKKVIAALQQLQQGDLKILTKLAYADVDESLHGIAKYSLWAHLIKLEKESLVKQLGEQWFYQEKNI